MNLDLMLLIDKQFLDTGNPPINMGGLPNLLDHSAEKILLLNPTNLHEDYVGSILNHPEICPKIGE